MRGGVLQTKFVSNLSTKIVKANHFYVREVWHKHLTAAKKHQGPLAGLKKIYRSVLPQAL